MVTKPRAPAPLRRDTPKLVVSLLIPSVTAVNCLPRFLPGSIEFIYLLCIFLSPRAIDEYRRRRAGDAGYTAAGAHGFD